MEKNLPAMASHFILCSDNCRRRHKEINLEMMTKSISKPAFRNALRMKRQRELLNT